MKKIKISEMEDILEKVYSNPRARKNQVPLFLGNPGLGKTSIIKEFAKKKGVNCLVELASTKLPHEFSGIAIPDHETKTMVYFNYQKLLDLKDGDILFLDEILNANPAILAAFLTVLQDRTLPSGEKLNDIMIVAASNPQGMTPLTPQIKQRFIWWELILDKKEFTDYFEKRYNFTKLGVTVLNNLYTIVQKEEFKQGHNFNSPRSVDDAVHSIIYNIPTPFDEVEVLLNNSFIENTLTEPIETKNKTYEVNEKIPFLEFYRAINKIEI